jgi:hypothetical protein
MQTYMELKLNIGSYCGLLWSLFGDHCNYYKELLKLYQILDLEECFTTRVVYTKMVCTQITWAIINDGRLFIGWNPVTLDFATGTQYYFSTSFLKGITDAVRNALVIQQARFPHKWLSPAYAGGDVWCTMHTCPPPAGH